MSERTKDGAETIRLQMETFVRAWETGEVDLLDSCVEEEPYVYFSTHWNCYSREYLKHQLLTPVHKTGKVRIFVANEMSRIYGDFAVQYATIIGYFAEGNEHLAFGATFTNRLACHDGAWLYTEMRFDLQSDDSVKEITLDESGHLHSVEGSGSQNLISDWKKPSATIGLFMDKAEEQGQATILAECDAPWYRIPDDENKQCDTDEVKKTFLRYCYALDQNTPDLFDGVFAENVRFFSNPAGELGMKDAVNYLTIVRQASARSFHAVRFDEVSLRGEHAAVRATRLSPEACAISASGLPCFDAGVYELTFTKCNGCWLIDSFAYRTGAAEGRNNR